MLVVLATEPWGARRFVLRGQELRYFKEECPFDSDTAPQVRKTPSWAGRWANFSLS